MYIEYTKYYIDKLLGIIMYRHNNGHLYSPFMIAKLPDNRYCVTEIKDGTAKIQTEKELLKFMNEPDCKLPQDPNIFYKRIIEQVDEIK